MFRGPEGRRESPRNHAVVAVAITAATLVGPITNTGRGISEDIARVTNESPQRAIPQTPNSPMNTEHRTRASRGEMQRMAIRGSEIGALNWDTQDKKLLQISNMEIEKDQMLSRKRHLAEA